jgi:GTP-binding protein EngB required for normal cell division
MSVVDRMRGAVRSAAGTDASALAARVDAVSRFLDAADRRVPAARLAAARTVVERAGTRLALSREHTVVALAGATGSGKSSIFNALSGRQLSRVGVRRPTTGVAHACVWGAAGVLPLLDWLGVPSGRRYGRESALDGEDEADLRGLVLLDLPDFDSIEETHRIEVDRLLGLVDLVIWVMDPQKYADRVVHQKYLAQFQRHREITVVLLNQADRLSRENAQRVVADLSRLLERGGLAGVPVLATSAKGRPGLDELRGLLVKTVAARQAALRRLAADVSGAVDELTPLVSIAASDDDVDRIRLRALTDALASAAGVPAVAEAAELAYRHRAAGSMGWPVARWVRRLRPDPLRRLHLPASTGDTDEPVAATSLPEPTATQQATVALAGRALAEQAAIGGPGRELPEPWPEALLAAARSRLGDVPDAMDVAIARTDLGLNRKPLWWRAVGALQWLATLAALVGLGWLAVRYTMFALALPAPPTPRVGLVPVPTALLVGGLLFGLLLSVLTRPIVRVAARRARRRAEKRLREAIGEVARELVVAPVREVLRAYALARAALVEARG